MTNILITGASSGIGAALADAYALPCNRLELFGRDAKRLDATVQRCRARGAAVESACFDITDFGRLIAEVEAADTRAPLDIAILNAGMGGTVPRDQPGQEVTTARDMAGVNFTAPVIAANMLASRMAMRRCGRIVLVGSIAALFPLPMAPTYSGTKAGLMMFADALRPRLRPHGVGVTLVSPGFVDTPMSRGLAEPKPFLIGADRAAAVIAKGIERGARHIVVPWQYAVLSGAAKLIPRSLVNAVLMQLTAAPNRRDCGRSDPGGKVHHIG
ncbi:MAG TPA: SDR family NAD(P)-dependent oxidoreductase [Rhizomicrobium sp.]|nr:SDR family NAD(P)-dependent oxidoreductase [Rhizomicrobium sp.]